LFSVVSVCGFVVVWHCFQLCLFVGVWLFAVVFSYVCLCVCVGLWYCFQLCLFVGVIIIIIII